MNVLVVKAAASGRAYMKSKERREQAGGTSLHTKYSSPRRQFVCHKYSLGPKLYTPHGPVTMRVHNYYHGHGPPWSGDYACALLLSWYGNAHKLDGIGGFGAC